METSEIVNLLPLDFLFYCTVSDFEDLLKKGLDPNNTYSFNLFEKTDEWIRYCDRKTEDATLFEFFLKDPRDFDEDYSEQIVLEFDDSPFNRDFSHQESYGSKQGDSRIEYFEKELTSSHPIDVLVGKIWKIRRKYTGIEWGKAHREIVIVLKETPEFQPYLVEYQKYEGSFEDFVFFQQRLAKIELMLKTDEVDLTEKRYLRSYFCFYHPSVMELLLQYGYQITPSDDMFKFFFGLMEKIKYGVHDFQLDRIIKIILQANSDIQLDHNLLIQVCSGSDNLLSDILLEVLIEHGADVNYQNEDGDTALIALCKNESFDKDCFDYLLECGADINLANRKGETMTSLLQDRKIEIPTKD